MAPCRQLLRWSVPSIAAVLLGIFWLRRKREFAKSDPGGTEKIRSLQEELAEALRAEAEASPTASLAIVAKSSPIDIRANGGRSHNSSLDMTDEEVDMEIEKIIRKRKSLPTGAAPRDAQRQLPATFCAQKMSRVSPARSPVHQAVPEREVALEISSAPRVELQDQVEPAPASPAHSVSDRLTVSPKHDNHISTASPDDNDTTDSSENSKSDGQQARRSSERDSANHSPSDTMLTLCQFSDNHSEGSNDSGKGCSEAASPPPAQLGLAASPATLRLHQFVIPQSLVGLLIGKQGCFVTQIKSATGARILIKKHPDSVKLKICAVEGTQNEIEAAIDMIRKKFPENKYPQLTLQEIGSDLYQRLIPLVPDFLQLRLVESVNNETIMTCLVSAGHFFLQQPFHPTFPSLQALHRLMGATYQHPDVPALPKPVKEGSICAAPTENNWYRAQVMSTSEESDTSVVKLVDFGGFLTLDNSLLKQIRSDFMTLPFQATEALLAFVKPANGAEEWCGEALRIMAAMTAGQLLTAQVEGYHSSGLPLTQLYLSIGPQQVIHLNRELVERGLAEWDIPLE